MGAGALFIGIGVGVSVIGILLFIVYIKKKNNTKKEYERYRSALFEWERTLGAQAKQIMEQADAIVNG